MLVACTSFVPPSPSPLRALLHDKDHGTNGRGRHEGHHEQRQQRSAHYDQQMQDGDCHRRQGYEKIEEKNRQQQKQLQFQHQDSLLSPTPLFHRHQLQRRRYHQQQQVVQLLAGPFQTPLFPLSPLPRPHGLQQVFLRRHFDPYQKNASVRAWVGRDTGE